MPGCGAGVVPLELASLACTGATPRLTLAAVLYFMSGGDQKSLNFVRLLLEDVGAQRLIRELTIDSVCPVSSVVPILNVRPSSA